MRARGTPKWWWSSRGISNNGELLISEGERERGGAAHSLNWARVALRWAVTFSLLAAPILTSLAEVFFRPDSKEAREQVSPGDWSPEKSLGQGTVGGLERFIGIPIVSPLHFFHTFPLNYTFWKEKRKIKSNQSCVSFHVPILSVCHL